MQFFPLCQRIDFQNRFSPKLDYPSLPLFHFLREPLASVKIQWTTFVSFAQDTDHIEQVPPKLMEIY